MKRFRCKKRWNKTIAMCLFILLITTSSVFAATQQEIDTAVTSADQWMVSSLVNDQSWQYHEASGIRNGSLLCSYLEEKQLAPDVICDLQSWLQTCEPDNYDFAARLLPYLTETQNCSQIVLDLLDGQNPDGGWGLTSCFKSDLFDTVIVMNALLDDETINPDVLSRGAGYILDRQNPDGSWSIIQGQPGSIYLTAETILVLNAYSIKHNPDLAELATSLRQGGDFLVAQQGSDHTWGTDEDNLMNTIQAYRAVLNTVGIEPVSATEDTLIDLQDANGSWNNDYYSTVLAAMALQEIINLPAASIDITLHEYIGEEEVENYTFQAYENIIIKPVAQYSQETAFLQLMVKQPDGKLVPARDEGFFYWNTADSPPGNYSVIAYIKDKASGKIIASSEKDFVIEADFKLSDIIISTSPKNCRVDQPVNTYISVCLVNQSNVDGEAALEVKVLAANGSTVASSNPVVSCSHEETIITATPLSFQPDVTVEQTYTITVRAEYAGQVAEIQDSFEVLPPPPPTRIDAAQILDKSNLYPGSDSATVTFILSGQGEAGVPPRNPIDLVMVIDNSGSMEFANVDYDYSRPNRMDFAKEASKHIFDLLQSEDRGGIVQFAGTVGVQQNLTADKELLKTRIDQMPPSPWDGTAIGKALQSSISLLDSQSIPGNDKIMFLISDGDENRWSDSSVVNQASIASQKGMKIYTIGLGNGADQNLLRAIATATGATYAFSPSMEQLAEIMKDVSGEIFNTAGENVVFTTTIPAGLVTIDTGAINPAPTSITVNPDGSTTISWNYTRIIMGEEINIPLAMAGNNLLSDTTVLLTTNTTLTYLDNNQDQVVVNLADLSLPVNKYRIDTVITVDKTNYLPGEDIQISLQAQNLSPSDCTLSGIIDIIDAHGVVADTVYRESNITWMTGQVNNFQYVWNVGDIMAGDYQVRARWFEGEQLIAAGTVPFAMSPGGEITNSVATDKATYNSNETVTVLEKVLNTSSNAIVSDLLLQTQIKDTTSNILWSADTSLNELPPASSQELKHTWDIEQNQPGEYTVVSYVYRSQELLCSDQAVFSILSSNNSTGIDGHLKLPTRSIYPEDNLTLNYSVMNTGNTPLENAQLLVRVVAPETEQNQCILNRTISLTAGEVLEDTINWAHKALYTGSYMLVFSAILEDGQEIPLHSGGFTVLKPLQVNVQQVVRPRILVWAESSSNIDLAVSTLANKQVFYKLVRDRNAFIEELSTGKYNTYLMMDTGKPLTGHKDKLVAAEVAAGKGLIATRNAYGDNFKNLAMFGVKFIGNNPKQNFTVNFLPGMAFEGSPDLSGSGKTQRVAPGSGVKQAVLDNLGEEYPAITLNHYESGKVMLFTFDLGSTLPVDNASAILWQAVETVAPTVEPSDTVVEVEIDVQELGEVNARVEAVVPQGVIVLWTSPASDSLTWDFESQPGQERVIRTVLDIPAGIENPCFIAYTAYLIDHEYWTFDSAETGLALP